jgi:hypothetical protein
MIVILIVIVIFIPGLLCSLHHAGLGNPDTVEGTERRGSSRAGILLV